jgi:hypothetical protein
MVGGILMPEIQIMKRREPILLLQDMKAESHVNLQYGPSD